jgi:hypothetical protein
MVARFDDAAEDVAKLGFIADELEQGCAIRAFRADAEDVFCSRIQTDDEEALVQ